MDSNLCAKFDLHILTGFWDTLVETEQQQQQRQQENWKVKIEKLNKSSTDYVI